MAVYKEPKTNTWQVIYRYTDWNGERKQSQKRGFQTKREAQSWEREQLNKLGSDLDMTFRSFVEHYEEDRRSRIKDSAWESKEHIIRTKLLPYFGKLKMSSITPQQIVRWQNELINYRDKDGAPYSPVYLKSIQNQISAIFNHAVRKDFRFLRKVLGSQQIDNLIAQAEDIAQQRKQNQRTRRRNTNYER